MPWDVVPHDAGGAEPSRSNLILPESEPFRQCRNGGPRDRSSVKRLIAAIGRSLSGRLRPDAGGRSGRHGPGAVGHAEQTAIDPRLGEALAFVDQTLVLSIEGEAARQRSAMQQLTAAGIGNFRFFPAFEPGAPEVVAAFRCGQVATFPPCFRCGGLECDRSDCNNVLVPTQIANFLGFMAMFRHVLRGTDRVTMIVEDDLEFVNWSADVLSRVLCPEALDTLGILGDQPALLRLANSRRQSADALLAENPEPRLVPGVDTPANPGFVFNRAFATLAIQRFGGITHTSDNYIHRQLAPFCRHATLSPPLIRDLSSGLRLIPSVLPRQRGGVWQHRNATVAEGGANSLQRHVRVVPLVVIGTPRCGTHFAAQLLAGLGCDVGHERMGRDGIVSWMFAVADGPLPFGQDAAARDSRFVHGRHLAMVVRPWREAVASLVLENRLNLQSFAFRRRWIQARTGIDVLDIPDDAEQALATWVYWNQICLDRSPDVVLRLGHALSDAERVLRVLGRAVDAAARPPLEPTHAGKRYLGVVHEKPRIDTESLLDRCDASVRRALDDVVARIDSLTGSVA